MCIQEEVLMMSMAIGRAIKTSSQQKHRKLIARVSLYGFKLVVNGGVLIKRAQVHKKAHRLWWAARPRKKTRPRKFLVRVLPFGDGHARIGKRNNLGLEISDWIPRTN